MYYPLKYFGQPRVIAEVLGGILLGPSVMMRIPGFKAAIFPDNAQPVLANVANLGLILFLFLTGLEVDIRLFLRDWKIAASVSFLGMIIPFGLGWAVAYGLFHQFKNEPNIVDINFGVFALFIGTALAITAFPVLCRILTELKLLGSHVGVTTLAAGVGNDVVGWYVYFYSFPSLVFLVLPSHMCAIVLISPHLTGSFWRCVCRWRTTPTVSLRCMRCSQR